MRRWLSEMKRIIRRRPAESASRSAEKRDDRGVTLIELIIGVLIASVVLVALFSMMTSSAMFYKGSSASISVSYSLQEAMSQTKETLIDCDTAFMTDLADGTTSDPAADTYFVAVNKGCKGSMNGTGGMRNDYAYTACVYFYDAPEAAAPGSTETPTGTLYYGEYGFNTGMETDLEQSVKAAAASVLAAPVTKFSITPDYDEKTVDEGGSSVTKKQMLKATLEISVLKNGKEDSARETVSFRNRPRVCGYDEIQD